MSLLAVAHRAGNSLEHLHRAVELGADVIEADVHHYRGRLEVRHEKTLGPLPWMWERWELLPADTARMGLAELLTAARHGTTFMLDLKGPRASVGRRVAEELHAFAPDRPVIVCSRYWPSLAAFDGLDWVRTVRSAGSRTQLALLLRVLDRGRVPRDGVSVHRSLLTPDVVAALHRHVELLMTWPVNDDDALAEVSALSASTDRTIGVISDEDAVLRQVLASRTT